jgi:succinate dehydrogenase/fumarate reductase flavoprotein subunit
MSNESDREVIADVLVIGGGLAGTWAALSAAEAGADVVLVDKGYCGTSGVTATAGVGHWYLAAGQRDGEIRHRSKIGGDLTDPAWMHRTMEVAWNRLPELDRYYRWPLRDGQFNRASSVRGPEYMRLMRGRVRRAGVRVLDHHPATELLLHNDGSVAGANGIRLQAGGGWSCTAAAVILATGGTAFLSRLLGSNNNTGDGHLMAAEAGAHFSAMEFACHYTVAPKHATMTRSIPYLYGTYRDGEGHELAFASWADGVPMIAKALAAGPVTVTLEKMPAAARERLPHVQPNFLLPLRRLGIDPFVDPFEITLRGEGTIRGTGGLEVIDGDCQTSVEGLFATGDVASRQRIVGASSGGGQPNAAWCIASGTWSGHAAARRAVRHRSRPSSAIGQAGLRPRGRGAAVDVVGVRETVRHELNDYEKNLFRSETGLRRSLAVLESLWDELAERASGEFDRDGLRTREAAALVATGRWCVSSAIRRAESRGMHQRTDAPCTDPGFTGTIEVGGLDSVWSGFEGTRQQVAS